MIFEQSLPMFIYYPKVLLGPLFHNLIRLELSMPELNMMSVIGAMCGAVYGDRYLTGRLRDVSSKSLPIPIWRRVCRRSGNRAFVHSAATIGELSGEKQLSPYMFQLTLTN